MLKFKMIKRNHCTTIRTGRHWHVMHDETIQQAGGLVPAIKDQHARAITNNRPYTADSLTHLAKAMGIAL